MSARPNPDLPETPLRRWRAGDTGFPYAELARRTRVTTRMILYIAAGERAPSAELAKAIRRETGVDLNELVAATLPPEPRTVRAVVLSGARAAVCVLDTPAARVAAVSRPGLARRRGVDL